MDAGFPAMGGYAAFVWPAYGISAIGIFAAVLLCLRSYRRAKQNLLSADSNAAL